MGFSAGPSPTGVPLAPWETRWMTRGQAQGRTRVCQPRECRRRPNHTQPGPLVYASCTAPPARPGSRDHLPAPRSRAWLLPAAPALLFASFGVTRSLSSSLSESFRPSPPPHPPPHPLPYNSSWLFLDRLAPPVMRRTAPSFQRGRRPRSTVVGFEGEARRGWGTLFRGGGCSGRGHFTTGGEVLYVQDGGAL